MPARSIDHPNSAGAVADANRSALEAAVANLPLLSMALH